MLTKAPLHKLKWVLDSEKSLERNFEFGPNAGPGCHLEPWGLTLGPLAWNAILKNCRVWPKMGPKLRLRKTSKDQNL